jgi:hypothetical protein
MSFMAYSYGESSTRTGANRATLEEALTDALQMFGLGPWEILKYTGTKEVHCEYPGYESVPGYNWITYFRDNPDRLAEVIICQ